MENLKVFKDVQEIIYYFNYWDIVVKTRYNNE